MWFAVIYLCVCFTGDSGCHFPPLQPGQSAMTGHCLKYSTDQLLRLRPSACSAHWGIGDLWSTLKNHGIHTHTVRGTRAGQFHSRTIQPIVTKRSAVSIQCKQPRPSWVKLVTVTCKQHKTRSAESGKRTGADCKKTLNLCLLNPWSVCNKTSAINDFIVDQGVDLLAVTETWLKGDSRDQVVLQEISPPGYKVAQQARIGKGGGIAMIHHENINMKCTPITNSGQFTSFEAIKCDISVKQSAIIFVIYRPPPSAKNGLSSKMFFTQFADFLEQHITSVKQLVILGDFNIHVDNPQDRDAQELHSLLDRFGLKQHVHQSTHRSGHTLDLVLSRSSESLVTNVHACDHGFPDHYPVFSRLSLQKPPNLKETVTFRKFKTVNVSDVSDDILNSALNTDLSACELDGVVSLYNSELARIIDVHAPLKTRTLTVREEAEWYTDNIRAAKQKRRQAERLWRKTGLSVHRDIFMTRREEVNNLIQQSKSDFYQNKISECQGNTKELFKVVNTLLGKSKAPALPSRPVAQLVEDFSTFFITKVKDIKASINPLSSSTPLLQQHYQVQSNLTDLVPASSDEIQRLISASPSKQCDLDPLPTKLLKACSQQLTPVITDIVNKSLENGEFPQVFKTALVSPLLKKPTLDRDTLRNFRPVSNLALVSKILEKVVAARLNKHMVDNNLEEPYQSAYRKGHSTETATLRVHNDIQLALGEKKCVLLVMIDLSAAFDTVDHKIILTTLQALGITGVALKWFESYLTHRSQAILISGTRSENQVLDCGVPQGSVLGPVLFTLYTAPLGILLRQRGLYHMYADDSTMYLVFKPEALQNSITHMEHTADLVREWMADNSLKMNDSKTEVMLITPKHTKLDCPSLRVGEHTVSPSPHVRSLGVYMDAHSTMEHHVNAVCRAAYMHLHNIHKIKVYLDKTSLTRLIHAFVTSKLDYGNALLLGYPASLLQRLQRVQNCAARILSGCHRHDHITPVMRELHWLPVTQRIQFKVAVLVFKAKHHLGPVYLQDLVTPYEPARRLRSANQDLLCVPATKSALVTQRAFSVAGPILWNSLPLDLRQSQSLGIFKQKLKTFLFVQYYD